MNFPLFSEKHFLKLDGATVCYRKTGQGPPLVLLPGYPLSGWTWRKVVAKLSEHFACYAVDPVGLGDSTSNLSKNFSSPGQAQILQQALSALEISQYSLIGNNSGGWIARELALLRPERVTQLVLTNTEIPHHRPPWIGLYQRIARIPGSVFLFQCMFRSRWWRRSGMGFGGCFEDPEFIDGEFYQEFLVPLIGSRTRTRQALQFLTNMAFPRVDEFAELHVKLSMPVAFVWATSDPTFPEALARVMSAQFPHVTGFHSVPRGKLFMHEEFPELACSPILGVLRR